MESYVHFCLHERQRIQRYLRKQKSLRFIADKLERSVSSISDEIKNNSVNGVYDAKKAHHKAYVKRQNSKVQCMKVSTDIELREFVETNIKDDQSPEGISGRLKEVEKHIQYASAKAIYKFVYSVNGRQIESHLYHNAVKRKGGAKKPRNNFGDGRTTIEKRPKRINLRAEFGHFEGDFIESGEDGKGSLLVIVERKTRYPFLMYLENRDTVTVNNAISSLLFGIDIRSLTLDNDLSFQKHKELSEILDSIVYFCHPHCPHEKGTTENRNKAIRRYAKKGSDLSQYPISHFEMIEEKLRTRFMECLNYRTPKEMFGRELQKQKIKQQKNRLIAVDYGQKKQEILI